MTRTEVGDSLNLFEMRHLGDRELHFAFDIVRDQDAYPPHEINLEIGSQLLTLTIDEMTINDVKNLKKMCSEVLEFLVRNKNEAN